MVGSLNGGRKPVVFACFPYLHESISMTGRQASLPKWFYVAVDKLIVACFVSCCSST